MVKGVEMNIDEKVKLINITEKALDLVQKLTGLFGTTKVIRPHEVRVLFWSPMDTVIGISTVTKSISGHYIVFGSRQGGAMRMDTDAGQLAEILDRVRDIIEREYNA